MRSPDDLSPPQVVGTISPQGLAALAALPAAERGADIVEARLDLAIAAPSQGAEGAPAVPALPAWRPFFAACAELERTGTPVLATIRLTADGGRWPLDGDRLPLFEEAMAVASWVDIELESALAGEVVALAHGRGRRVIVSHHDFSGTPEPADLEALVARARVLGADVVKVATAVRALADHDRLLELQRRQRASLRQAPLALIAMGALGTSLRSYLPAVGSRFTYGHLDGAVAPGQIPAAELVQRLLRDCPAYSEWRRVGGAL